MPTNSLLWLPVVYFGYTCSQTMAVCSVLYVATLLFQPVFIITISVLLSLHYILSLPICYCLLSLCIAVYLYMTMPAYGCYVSLVFDLAIPSFLSLPSHMS